MKAALLALALLLAGCSGQEMDRQPSLKTTEATTLFPDGTTQRPRPPGTVARGDGGRAAVLASPPPLTAALMARGRRDYGEFCQPCHGIAGDGDGMVVRRGFSPPPSYHSARLRAAPAAHIVEVIGKGYGAMYAYGDRVPPQDRWAIAAYVRALQTARATPLALVPEARELLP